MIGEELTRLCEEIPKDFGSWDYVKTVRFKKAVLEARDMMKKKTANEQKYNEMIHVLKQFHKTGKEEDV